MSQTGAAYSVHAYAETQKGLQALSQLSADRRLDNASILVKLGGIKAAYETYQKVPTPNILILESEQGRDELMNQLGALAEHCDLETKVYLVLGNKDDALRQELLGMGIQEVYFDAPDIGQIAAVILQAVPAAAVDTQKSGIVSVISARAGCGGSSIAHNLAWSLGVDNDLTTALIDLDITMGTAALNYFRDPVDTIETALNEGNPTAISGRFLKNLCVHVEGKLNLLASSANMFMSNELPANALEPIGRAMTEEFKQVVLDLPPDWSLSTRNILVNSGQVVVVCGPDLPSLRNAKNITTFLSRHASRDQVVHIVLNKAGEPKRKEISEQDFEETLEIPIAVTVPFDATLLSQMELNGQMPLAMAPKSGFSKKINELAQFVVQKSAVRFEDEYEVQEDDESLISGLLKKFANR